MTQDTGFVLAPEVMASLQKQLEEAATAHRSFFAEVAAMTHGLKETSNLLAQIDWSDFERRMTEQSSRLASLGWTIAPWMSFPDVEEFLLLDTDALDKEFVRLYLDAGGLDTTEAVIIKSPRLKRWRPLLVQVVEALRREEFLIAIPALLLTLEGFVAQFATPVDVELTNAATIAKGLKPRHGEKTIRAMIWTSTVAFLSQLYKSAPFSDQCPSFLNRHWILHGRKNAAEWTVADAIRVLNALSTLDWLLSGEERHETATQAPDGRGAGHVSNVVHRGGGQKS